MQIWKFRNFLNFTSKVLTHELFQVILPRTTSLEKKRETITHRPTLLSVSNLLSQYSLTTIECVLVSFQRIIQLFCFTFIRLTSLAVQRTHASLWPLSLDMVKGSVCLFQKPADQSTHCYHFFAAVQIFPVWNIYGQTSPLLSFQHYSKQ